MAVWYPWDLLRRAVTVDLSFIVLVTVLFALSVAYLLVRRKKP